MRSRIWRIVAVVAAIVVLAIAGFVVWAETPLGPTASAEAALVSSEQVTVTEDQWLRFVPARTVPTTGLIFYPGGRVDPRSYAPLANALAARGTLVVIVPMPLNLAVLAPQRAADVIAAYPAIQHWALAGHSLGGAMACTYVDDHPDQIHALALLASYCADGDDISTDAIAVVQVSGARDGVLNQERLQSGAALLPPTTQRVLITGGNHAQFGSYGPQPGDNPAETSAATQLALTVNAIQTLLTTIAPP